MWEKLRPVWALILIAVAFDLALLVLSFFVGGPESIPLNIMSVIFGMGMSIPMGFLLSPLTREEEFQFNSIGKALLTFVSGYLISKLDRTIEAALAPDLILSAVAAFRLAAFVLCFSIGVPAVYMSRLQWLSKSRQSVGDNQTLPRSA